MPRKVTKCVPSMTPLDTPAVPPYRASQTSGRSVVSVKAWKLLLKVLGKYLVGTALKTRVCETAKPTCHP